jgi:thiosulfate/3-mercaptopyruvate sulfurtransferase
VSRYLIIGAGAVGATLAAQLHDAGREVVLIARGRNSEALRTNGLRYIRPQGARTYRLPVVSGPEEVTLRQNDILVLSTKSQDTEAVLQDWAWRPVTGETASSALPVVLLQNGLDNERVALRRFATVVGGVVWMPSSHIVPGEVVSPAEPAVGALWLGAYPAGDYHGLTEDFTAAGFLVTVVPDIRPWKAAKLLENVANVLDALYRPSPLRDIATRALQAEARTVLTEAGFAFADPGPENVPEVTDAVVTREIPGHPRRGSSTWQSLARHAPLETDFLNGEIVLQARLLGREAPLNAAVTQRAHQVSEPRALGDEDLRRTLPELLRRHAGT